MASDGKLIFDTEIDLSGIQKGLSDIAKATQATFRKVTEELSSMGKSAGKEAGEKIQEGVGEGTSGIGDMLTKVVSTVSWKDAGKALVNFAKEGVQTASDLAKSQKVIDATFGSSAKEMSAWAKDAKNAYGISELSAQKFTGTMGIMLKSMGKTDKEAAEMSQSIVGLAGDMASFYDLSPEEAFNMLKDAVEGNSGALKSLSVEMTDETLQAYLAAQGSKTLYGEMTEAEKATLRYRYVMDATADAQGDFAESSDSAANQMSLLKLNVGSLASSIGEVLLPWVNGALTAVNGVVTAFTGLFSGTGKTGLVDEISASAQSLANLQTATTTAETEYAETVGNIEARKQLADDYLAVLEEIENKVNLTDEDELARLNATTALVNLYPDLKDHISDETGLFTSNTDALRNNISALNDHALAKASQVLSAKYEDQIVEATVNLVEATTQHNSALAELEAAQEKELGIESALAELMGNSYEGVSALNGAYVSSLPGIESYMEKLEDGSWVVRDSAGMYDSMSKIVDAFQNGIGNAATEVDMLTAAEQTAANTAVGYEQEVKDLTAKLEDEKKTIEGLIVTTDASTAATEAQGAAIEDTGEKVEDFADKTADAAGKMEDANATIGGEIDDLETKAQTVISLYEQIKEATTAGTEAEGTLAAAKLRVSEDSAAMITDMETLLVNLGAKIKEFVDTVPVIVADGELGATTAGKSLVAAIGTGAGEDTTFTAAVTAQVSAAVTVLVSNWDIFYAQGASIISQLAAGVNSNSSVLANAVANAVTSAVNAANTGSNSSSNRKGLRTGLDYVPYDEYPANLHKGEAVLTATEAALWRGGLNARDMQLTFPKTDYDAMADAFWARAPQSEAPNLYLDGERVARLIEPALSKVQEIKLRR